ncbi:O-antigen ligase family protein [Odoribacter sp. OttesenSCG-928-A06]|nr:O-antigen ligase family protein [Odoribacter sp. OttesenSCG-928-A06]
MKGVLYPEGGISVGIAMLELLLCAFFLLKVVFVKKIPNIALALIVLVFVVTISFLFSPMKVSGFIIGEVGTFAMYRNIIGAVLPFFPLYYLSRKGEVGEALLKAFYFCIFIVTIFVFIRGTFLAIEEKNTEATVNEAYRFVFLLPYVVMLKRKWIFVLVAISLTFIILSAKRGALLTYFIGLMIYAYYFLKSNRHLVRNIIALLLLFAIIAYIGIEIYNSNPYLQLRLEETLDGNTSSRDYLIGNLLSHWYNSDSIIDYFIGAGFCQSVSIAGNYAHNDWVEFLVDMGGVGLIVYSLSYFALFRFYFFCKNIPHLPSFALIVYILLLTSLYSMAFFNEPSSFCFILLGYLLGKSECQRCTTKYKLQ